MRSISHTESFNLAVPIADLFPLFSPEGEKLWVPDWDYVDVMGTADLCEDYIFVTRTHDHASAEAVWIVKTYDPAAHYVQFYKVEPGEKVGVISVRCNQLDTNRTNVEITYKYIALSVSGERFIDEFTDEVYKTFIGEWQLLLSNYFETRS